MAMVAPVEVGEGGIDLLIRNELLKQHETRDKRAVGEACLAALEQWSEGRGARSTGQGHRALTLRARRNPSRGEILALLHN